MGDAARDPVLCGRGHLFLLVLPRARLRRWNSSWQPSRRRVAAPPWLLRGYFADASRRRRAGERRVASAAARLAEGTDRGAAAAETANPRDAATPWAEPRRDDRPLRHFGPEFGVQMAWSFVVCLASLFMPKLVEPIAVGAIAGMSSNNDPRVIPNAMWITFPAIVAGLLWLPMNDYDLFKGNGGRYGMVGFLATNIALLTVPEAAPKRSIQEKSVSVHGLSASSPRRRRRHRRLHGLSASSRRRRRDLYPQSSPCHLSRLCRY